MSSSDVACVIAVSLQLLRMSVDLVQLASQQSSAPAAALQHNHNHNNTTSTPNNASQHETAKLTQNSNKKSAKSYGSVEKDDKEKSSPPKQHQAGTDESEPLLSDEENPANNTGNNNDNDTASSPSIAGCSFSRFHIFCAIWSSLTLVGLIVAIRGSHPALQSSTVVLLIVELLGLFLDKERILYGSFQRLVRLMAWIILWVTLMNHVLNDDEGRDEPTTTAAASSSSSTLLCWWSLGVVSVAVLVAVADGWLASQHPTPARRASLSSNTNNQQSTPTLSRQAILQLIRPYFWPDATDETAFWNRVRAIATWVCVICSKACNLVTPLLLGQASTALAHGEYAVAIRMSIWYGIIKFLGNTFKEGQSLVYLKVAQAAFVQLAQASFQHLHQLSLDWHLRKKMGEVLRSMDRGISACDTLMKYLFLWLVPALAECLLVTIIFATYFQYFPLAVAVFYFVFAYVVWTILVTLWRKKFRKALVKHDNDYHDLFTDSMINFETVKYFTAEEFEKNRFKEAVARYQVGSVHVQGSLSFLNVSQQFILQACMATALSLAAWGIQKRISCCTETAGCEAGISDCCRNVSNDVCPGMEVGDFVAVLTYISQLFQPLNFLGSVYNAVVMALIDLANLSELLAESPDVIDAPDAFPLPETNAIEPDIAVEFDNVHFHYPTQPEDRGLKGLSFKMKKGTTTAIVGPTGAGKTTVSRLLFRFYDTLGGAVKINGVDVRSVTQKSLRGSMGVVPQAASMFNDTIRFNLLYGRPEATEEELVKAAEDAQILGFIESLDDGWETMVGDRGLKLSGGEKQRAAIARCLLKNPPFVLLDEATSALDTITENSVQEALDRLGEERTVLVIAHRLGTIRNADNIIVLKDGKVAEEGTHDDLLAKNGVYADMWNMQLHSASGSQTDLAGPIDQSHVSTAKEVADRHPASKALSPSSTILTTTIDSVVRTARDAQLAKASAFLSAGYSFEGLPGINNQLEESYAHLLQAAWSGERMRRQSPLVNAGYALRVATIMKQISSFLNFHEVSGQSAASESKSLNLLVLGGGLDFLPLATLLSSQQTTLHVVEIDFKSIVEAKRKIIATEDFQAILSRKMSSCEMNHQTDSFQLSFENTTKSTYTMITGDLKNVANVESSLDSLETGKIPRPTLVLSELVLAYIPDKERLALLHSLSARFLHHSPGSSMILYEPLGSNANNPTLAASVSRGYQQTYFESFQTKLEKGSSSTAKKNLQVVLSKLNKKNEEGDEEYRVEEEEETMFHPLAESALAFAKMLHPYRINSISADRASLHIAPFLKSPELFDEHAALQLYLRSYSLTCIFDDSRPTILERVMCSWSSASPTTVPRCILLPKMMNPQSAATTSRRPIIWMTPIQACDEEQVRTLFVQSYQHLFKAYPSVQKMTKTALKKDLAVNILLNLSQEITRSSTPTITTRSSIGQYYHEQNGIFLVAVVSSSHPKDDHDSPPSPKVIGSIGVRKCDTSTEKGLRQTIPGATYEIHRLFVHPDYQSQGIAHQLLDMALNELNIVVGDAFVLATTLVLLEGAIRFYERQGFEVMEETEIVSNLQLRTYGKTVQSRSS